MNGTAAGVVRDSLCCDKEEPRSPYEEKSQREMVVFGIVSSSYINSLAGMMFNLI